MILTVSNVSTCTITRTFISEEQPVVTSLSSCEECCGSSIVIDRGSPKQWMLLQKILYVFQYLILLSYHSIQISSSNSANHDAANSFWISGESPETLSKTCCNCCVILFSLLSLQCSSIPDSLTYFTLS